MPRVTILYHRRDTAPAGTTIRAHRHAFWQLEAVLRGRLEIVVKGTPTLVRAGHCYLVPPQVTHALRHPVEADYISIKFESPDVSAALAGLMPASPCSRDVLSALGQLLPVGEARRATLAEEVGSLVSMLLAHWHRLGVKPVEAPEGAAARVKREADAAKGRIRNVQTIARAAGLSRGHALAAFQSAYGRTLKAYLDEVSVEEAAAMLCYSERSLGEIAEALAFPDLFTFSRFFRRLRGEAPSAYRTTVRSQRRALLKPE